MSNTLLITCHHLLRHFGKFAARLQDNGVVPLLPAIPGQQFSAEQMRELIVGQRLVIAGDDFIDRSALEAGKAAGLKAVIKWGIGTDSIDKEAARELGIPVYNTPGVFSDEVADCAAGYVVNLARGLHLMDASVRSGGWLKIEGMSLAGRTAGVVGLGGIGRATCRRMAAFGLKVIGYDPAEIAPALLAEAGAIQVPLDQLLAESDVVVLTCSLTPQSHHLLSEPAFTAMKSGVLVVNVARGPVVDESALVAALAAGKVRGAALDVFEEEPLPAASPLRNFDNVMFGTHNCSNTADAVHRVNTLTVELALDLFGLSGRKPRLEPLVAA